MPPDDVLWSWEYERVGRALPSWVEPLATLVMVPAVTGLTALILISYLDFPGSGMIIGSILVLVIVLAVVARRVDEAGGNRQTIRIYRDRLWSRVGRHEFVYRFEGLTNPECLIHTESFVKTLVVHDASGATRWTIPLIGMEQADAKRLLDALKSALKPGAGSG